MVSYPKDLPMAEVLELIQIIRGGKAKENVGVVAHRLWVLQGFAMKATLGDPTGDPDTAPLFPFNVEKPEGFCALDELEKHCLAHQDDAVVTQGVVPWGLIIKWAVNELIVLLA